jgi:hypothetical protein
MRRWLDAGSRSLSKRPASSTMTVASLGGATLLLGAGSHAIGLTDGVDC